MQNAAPDKGKRHLNQKSCTPIVQDFARNPQSSKKDALIVKDSFLTKLHIGFEVYEFSQIDELTEGRDVYIFDDPDTPEVQIRNAAWKLGGECKIHSVRQSLDSLSGSSRAAGELSVQIIEFAQPYKDWSARLNDEPLTIDEATEIAKAAFKSSHLNNIARQVELANLAARVELYSKAASFQWSKIVGRLEDEFRRELEARGIGTQIKTDQEAEILRLNVQQYIAEKDPIKRELLLKEFRKQGYSTKSIEGIATHLDRGNSTPKAQRFKPQELLDYKPEGLGWVFPGLLPKSGITFLVAPPGAGKSTLAYDAAASVILNEPFLGELPTSTGKVLILCGDEPLDYVQDKLISRGFYGNLGNWELIYNWDVTQWEVAEQAIEDIRPTLVIIDSFASIHSSSQIDENSSLAANTIYKLNGLLERYNACGICIHHANKNREQKGVNKVRGSSAIAAASSAIWLLEGDGTTKNFSTPKIRGGATPVSWNISLDVDSGQFKVIGGNEQLEQCKPVIRRVKDLFEQLGSETRLELDEIKHHIGGVTSDSLRQAISRLCNQGVLVKAPSKRNPRRKTYYLSPKYITPNPPPHTDSSILSHKMAETNTQQELELCDKLRDNSVNSCDNPPRNNLKNTSCHVPQTIDIQESGELSVTSSSEVGGEGVVTTKNEVIQDTGTDSEQCETIASYETQQFKVNQTVYPTVGKYQGKQCKVSAIANNEIWAYPVTTQPGVAGRAYQASELTLNASVAINSNEPEGYQIPIDWKSDEYLEALDD